MSRAIDQYFFEKAALGLVDGVEQVILNANNAAISTSSETFWSVSSAYAQLTAAVAFEAVSSNAADAAAGTGARTISVELIDGNYTRSTVTVTLNGATPVAITGTFIACNCIQILTAGSGLVNAGNVDIRTVSGSVVKRRMPTGLGKCDGIIYTIPAGFKGLLKRLTFGASGVTGEPACNIQLNDSAGLLKLVAEQRAGFSAAALSNAQGQINFGAGLSISEKTLLTSNIFSVGGSAGNAMGVAELYVFDGSKNVWGL